MKNRMGGKSFAALWTAILAAAAIVSSLILPAIPQDPSYHNFADSRLFLGIPNTLDVLSNVPLIVLGVVGIVLCRQEADPNPAPELVRLKIIFFITVILTGVGSSIYHWRPDNFTIIWDRLPLSVMFMVLYLVVLADRISSRAAAGLLWITLAAGPASVLYWYWSELQGAGDLRFYGIIQLLPLLLIPATMLLRPHGTIKNAVLWKAFALYALAKIFEFMDGQIFAWTGFVSGHTLKHLCAGVAVYCLLAVCKNRRTWERAKVLTC
jgi:hypothetical protein